MEETHPASGSRALGDEQQQPSTAKRARERSDEEGDNVGEARAKKQRPPTLEQGETCGEWDMKDTEVASGLERSQAKSGDASEDGVEVCLEVLGQDYSRAQITTLAGPGDADQPEGREVATVDLLGHDVIFVLKEHLDTIKKNARKLKVQTLDHTLPESLTFYFDDLMSGYTLLTVTSQNSSLQRLRS